MLALLSQQQLFIIVLHTVCYYLTIQTLHSGFMSRNVPGPMQCSSSDPSWQCSIPSQRNSMWMHLRSETHVNSWSSEQDDSLSFSPPRHTNRH